MALVRTMAGKTVLGKDGANVEAEIRRRLVGHRDRAGAECPGQHSDGAPRLNWTPHRFLRVNSHYIHLRDEAESHAGFCGSDREFIVWRAQLAACLLQRGFLTTNGEGMLTRHFVPNANSAMLRFTHSLRRWWLRCSPALASQRNGGKTALAVECQLTNRISKSHPHVRRPPGPQTAGGSSRRTARNSFRSASACSTAG